MEINKKDVGRRIAEIRKQNNLSMDEFANIAGVKGKSTVNEWEKGRSLPSQSSVNRISQYFGIDSITILYGSLQQLVKDTLVRSYFDDSSSEFSSTLFEYLSSTTNIVDWLSGITFDPETLKPVSDDEQELIYSNIEHEQIEKAINENVGQIISQLTLEDRNNMMHGLTTPLLNKATLVFKKLIKQVKQTFTGKYYEYSRFLEKVDPYEYFKDDLTLDQYLADSKSDPLRKNLTTNQIIDKYYQVKFYNLLRSALEQASDLKFSYMQAQKEHEAN